MEVKKDNLEKKFKKDILVKYLYYEYICDNEIQDISTPKKVKIRIGFSSIFFTLLSYKKNKIELKYTYGNIYYNTEDFNNTCYNLNKNKIYNGTNIKEIKEEHIKNYLDFFFKELFGEFETDKKRVDKYNFDKNKFKQYFNQKIFNEEEDKYNSDDITYSKKDMEEKEKEINKIKEDVEKKEYKINELKDYVTSFKQKIQIYEMEKEKLKNKNLELREKNNEYEKQIKEYEKQLEISNRFKESLKEYLK